MGRAYHTLTHRRPGGRDKKCEVRGGKCEPFVPHEETEPFFERTGGVSTVSPISTRILTAVNLPTGVKDLDEPPECLFLTGTLPAGPRVAIVGTRRPTIEAYRFAQELARQLATAGVAVVSGGAVGIDTAAHEGALQAGAGTLVVAPASYSRAYPEVNRALFARVVENGGGYLTPFVEPTTARRHEFFARNALMVSLCVAVILVQAPHRSGARNATHWARELKRPYWVVPHAPWCSQGASNVAELRSGGMPLSGSGEVVSWLSKNHHAPIPLHAALHPSVQSLVDGAEIGAQPMEKGKRTGPRVVRGEAAGRAGLDDTQPDVTGPHRDVCRLVAQLTHGPRHADELCVILGWEPGHLQATVLHATLLGEVRRNDAGLLVSCSRG
jgi:DNA processing protein